MNPFLNQVESNPLLRDVFDGWEDGEAIFDAISNYASTAEIDLPWEGEEAGFVDPTVLDIEYFGNHSGSKFCSPLVMHLLNSSGKVPSTARTTLAKIILSKYYPNWKYLWATVTAEYNPIHNYDMTEERDLSTTADNVETTDGTKARTGTDTLAHGLTHTTTHGRTTDEMDYRYGINTADNDPKPSDKMSTEEGGTTVTADSGSDIRTYNLSDDDDTTITQDNEGTEHEELHRSGNIGVTTTQQMLESERRLWLWNYFDQIFKDLDRELALMVYDPCRV